MKSRKDTLRGIACLLLAILPGLAGVPYSALAEARSGMHAAQPEQRNTSNTSTPIGKMLNRDGTLNLAGGFSGSLDPRGYAMQTGSNGEPRFVASESGMSEWAAQGDDRDNQDNRDNQGKAGPEPLIPGFYTWDARFNPRGPSFGVRAVTTNGADVYAGGHFTMAGQATAQRVARWNGSSWLPLGSGLNEAVYALAYAGGNLYVGGAFTQAGGAPANHIARWDGSAWYALGSGTDGTVGAIMANGSDIYVGGSFATAGGLNAAGIAKWNGSAWSPLGAGVGAGGSVLAIAANGTDVYVGGTFSTAGGVTANNIARWDGTSWHSLLGGTDDSVFAIAGFGSYLYVGGAFDSVNGDPNIRYVARWHLSASQWSSLGTGVNSPVTALVHSSVGYGLYVGGGFSSAGGLSASHVAMWNTSGGGWSVLGPGSSNGVSGQVHDMGMSANGYLFVGGEFAQAGGSFYNGGVVAQNIARWSASWSALGAGSGVSSEPLVSVYTVLAVTIGGTTNVYVGGNFRAVGGVPANNVARWDGSTWYALGTGANNGVGSDTFAGVYALARGPGSEVYVGGQFVRAGGITVNNVAKWSGSGWSALNGGTNNSVFALAYNNYDLHLYVGGFFTQVGGNVPAKRIARFSNNVWSKLGHGTSSTLEGVSGGANIVYAIAISDLNHKVYVGGSFTSAGGQSVDNLAVWGQSGTSFFWGRLGSANSTVRALAFLDNDLYVGGDFTMIDAGVMANRIARYDFGTVDWYALGSGVNDTVDALAVTDSVVYVGGEFTAAGGTAASKVAGWNGSAWYSIGEIEAPDDPSSYTVVNSLATAGTTLYLGGGFQMAGGKPSINFARRYWVSLP